MSSAWRQHVHGRLIGMDDEIDRRLPIGSLIFVFGITLVVVAYAVCGV